MTRIEALVLLLGLLLIAFGLALGARLEVDSGETLGKIPDSNVSIDDALGDSAFLGTPNGRREETSTASPVVASVADGAPRSLTVQVLFRDTGTAAAGAKVGLWRRPTGEGPGYRAARRLAADQLGDLNGRARFDGVTPSEPLQLLAALPGGERTYLDVPPPGADASAPWVVAIEVERLPAPLRLVFKDPDGRAIPGVSARSAPQNQGPTAEFPSGTQLLKRSGPDGSVELEGEIRRSGWIVIDAATYGPVALPLTSLEGQTQSTLTLHPAGELELEITSAEGPLNRAVVTVSFELGGFRAQRTATTGRMGQARIGALPHDVGLDLEIEPRGAESTHRESIAGLVEGESRRVGISVD